MKELSLQLKENADLPLIQILFESFRFFSWNLAKFIIQINWLKIQIFLALNLVEIST